MGKGPKVPQNVATSESDLLNSYSNLGKQFGAAGGLAQNFWSQVLGGGPGAANAVAPAAMNINETATGAQNAINSFMPAGGERNLASAQLQNQKQGQIANLYANVQPQAANALTGIAGLGSSFGGVGANAGGSLLSLAGNQAQAKGQALGGLGQGIGTFLGGTKLAGKV